MWGCIWASLYIGIYLYMIYGKCKCDIYMMYGQCKCVGMYGHRYIFIYIGRYIYDVWKV